MSAHMHFIGHGKGQLVAFFKVKYSNLITFSVSLEYI